MLSDFYFVSTNLKRFQAFSLAEQISAKCFQAFVWAGKKSAKCFQAFILTKKISNVVSGVCFGRTDSCKVFSGFHFDRTK